MRIDRRPDDETVRALAASVGVRDAAVELLSAGALGHVYVAREEERRKAVVVKLTDKAAESAVGYERALYSRDEAGAYRLLTAEGISVPRPRLLAAGTTPGGVWAKYLVLSEIRGEALDDVGRTLPAPERVRLAAQLGSLLARVHAIAAPAAADPARWLGELRGVLESVLSRLEGTYPEAGDLWRGARAIASEASRRPQPPQSLVFVHGDYCSRNIVLNPVGAGRPRVIAILDWEWSSFADAAFESAKIELEHAAGTRHRIYRSESERRAFWDAYERVAGSRPVAGGNKRLYSLFHAVAPLPAWLSLARARVLPPALRAEVERLLHAAAGFA